MPEARSLAEVVVSGLQVESRGELRAVLLENLSTSSNISGRRHASLTGDISCGGEGEDLEPEEPRDTHTHTHRSIDNTHTHCMDVCYSSEELKNAQSVNEGICVGVWAANQLLFLRPPPNYISRDTCNNSITACQCP